MTMRQIDVTIADEENLDDMNDMCEMVLGDLSMVRPSAFKKVVKNKDEFPDEDLLDYWGACSIAYGFFAVNLAQHGDSSHSNIVHNLIIMRDELAERFTKNDTPKHSRSHKKHKPKHEKK